MSLHAIDTIFRDYKNNAGLEKELNIISELGFVSKLAIHPAQIDVINKALTPTKDDIKKAKMILKHESEIENLGVISIDGIMYDSPHLKWAKKVIDYFDQLTNQKER